MSGTPSAITTIGFAASTSSTSTSTTSSTSTSATSSSSATSITSTSSTSTSSTPASSPASSAALSSPTAPAQPAAQPSNAPSTGLIAGVAAGVSVGVIGLAAAGFMLYRRHRTRKPGGTQQPPHDGPTFGHGTVNIEDENKKVYEQYLHYNQTGFSQSPAVFELPVERPRTPELPASRR
jgi:hypothetical protein